MSMTDNRFEISCNYCGVLDHYAKKDDALMLSRIFDEFSHKDCATDA